MIDKTQLDEAPNRAAMGIFLGLLSVILRRR